MERICLGCDKRKTVRTGLFRRKSYCDHILNKDLRGRPLKKVRIITICNVPKPRHFASPTPQRRTRRYLNRLASTRRRPH